MSNVTIYQKLSPYSPKYYKSINYALSRIRDGKSKEAVYAYRTTGDKSYKMGLPAILFSGEFSYREAKSLINHSGFICIDFDKFPDSETLNFWKDTIEGDQYTYCIFTSPSGNGLKCIVKIPKIPDNHKGYFDALKDHYQCPYFDISCSDISRVCFESYDPNLTVNENSKLWETVKEYKPIVFSEIDTPADEQKTAQILLKWWLKKYGVFSGQRNSNMFKLCAAMNDAGISKENTISIVSTFQQEDFKIDEILTCVKSAYKRTHRFGTLKFKNNGK